ncbi:hypothetical protein A3Q56_07743 [Intoshia linei]|uniref:Uncharacterized protein n=1 Tax=Intoshia linei TaxID=1819745 RepID=A0A177AT38_9BILA|nr:hypothetical protein A3Q56_07743 [Intoshia linei]
MTLVLSVNTVSALTLYFPYSGQKDMYTLIDRFTKMSIKTRPDDHKLRISDISNKHDWSKHHFSPAIYNLIKDAIVRASVFTYHFLRNY